MNKTDINYTKELFLHDNNLFAAGGVVALSAVTGLLAGPLGVVPLILFGTVQFLMWLGGVQHSDKWTKYVDDKYRRQQRISSRARLLSEIKPFEKRNKVDTYLRSYRLMEERIQQMYLIADDGRSNINKYEVEKFEDMSLNYLTMLLAWIQNDRGGSNLRVSEAVGAIAELESKLKAGQEPRERASIQKAINDYKGILERAKRRDARMFTVQASLSTIPDKLEEIYQMVVASPYSNDIGAKVEESLNSLLVQEEVESLIESEMAEFNSNIVPMRDIKRKQTA